MAGVVGIINRHSKACYAVVHKWHLSYKGECGVCISKGLKEELDWAIDKWLCVISIVMLFKQLHISLRNQRIKPF